MCLIQIIICDKTVSCCSRCNIQKKLLFKTMLFQFKFLWIKGNLKHYFLVNKSSIYPEKHDVIIQNKFLGYSEWKGSARDVTFQAWHLKEEKKIASLHSYLKRSMPETLFETLKNLLYSLQKHLSVRILIIQKPVKWFKMQNGWFPNSPHF